MYSLYFVIQQKSLLETALIRALDGFKGLSSADLVDWVTSSGFINTIDSFQGQEAEFVLVSLTKSKKSGLGFSKDQKRANVMLSRASKLLAIFGDWENSAGSQAPSTLLLIPAMAHWAREKDVLYQVAPTGALVPYEPSLSAAAPVPSTRVAKKSAVPVSLKVKATAVKNSTRIATGDRSYTLTADDNTTCLLFVLLITERPDKKISLSELGSLYPREIRACGSLSLLAYTRLLPGFLLSLADNKWFLSLAPPTSPVPKPVAVKAPRTTSVQKLPVTAAAFQSAVKRVLERAPDGMSLSQLGEKLPRVAQGYPLGTLKWSLEALDTVVVDGEMVTLKDPFNSEVLKILRISPKGLHIGQLGNALAGSGIVYPRPTLKHSLQSLSSVVLLKTGAIYIVESKWSKSKSKKRKSSNK